MEDVSLLKTMWRRLVIFDLITPVSYSNLGLGLSRVYSELVYLSPAGYI